MLRRQLKDKDLLSPHFDRTNPGENGLRRGVDRIGGGLFTLFRPGAPRPPVNDALVLIDRASLAIVGGPEVVATLNDE